jgi:hypothetical protein
MTEDHDQVFVSAVLEVFARLLDEGYEVTDVRPTRIEFSKRARRVIVCRSRDGEIDVALGSRSNAFGLDEFIRLCVGEGTYKNFAATDRDGIPPAVEATANRLFEYPNVLTLAAPPSEIVRHNSLQYGSA